MENKEFEKRKEAIENMSDDTLFYWQSYGYIGNCLNLWRLGDAGYTTNLDEAELHTKEETLIQLSCRRDQDNFWPQEVLEDAAKKTINIENVRGKSL